MKTGDTAPAWSATDQNGQQRSSAEFTGKAYVLYFYPEDDTPGCTAEACAFRDKQKVLDGRIDVVGVSADSVESHKAFADKYGLPFTLLADTERTIHDAYGILTEFPKRTTFLIGTDGTLLRIYHDFDPPHHASDIESDLAEFGL